MLKTAPREDGALEGMLRVVMGELKRGEEVMAVLGAQETLTLEVIGAAKERRQLWEMMVTLMGRYRDLGVMRLLRRGNREWEVGLLITRYTVLRARLRVMVEQGSRAGKKSGKRS